MQLISNILFSIILIYPSVFLREYCIGDERKIQLKRITDITLYFLLITMVIIISAFYLEAFIFFYVILLIPSGIALSNFLMKHNDIQRKLLSEGHVLGIKEKRFALLMVVYIVLFVLLNLTNYAVNNQVMQVNNEVLNKLKSADDPALELIGLSQNPDTLIYEVDKLVALSEKDYSVIYSGNALKIVRGTIQKDNTIYEYDLTYRRTGSNKWELDGLYTSREKQTN